MKSHIFRKSPATAAFRLKNVPIGPPNVVARRKSESSSIPIDRARVAFQFEKRAYGCFIQVQVEPRKAKAGSIFFVAKTRLEPDRTKQGRPFLREADGQFPLQLFLVARPRRGGSGPFRCHDGASDAPRNCSRAGGCLDSQAKQPPAAAEVTVRGVVQRVLLKDAPGAMRAEPAQPRNHFRHVPDSELDFDLAKSRPKSHAPSINLPGPTARSRNAGSTNDIAKRASDPHNRLAARPASCRRPSPQRL